MAPQIVSWGPGWKEVKFSPVLSNAPCVIPIESLCGLSSPCPKSPIIPEPWRARTTEPGARPASFLGMGPRTGENEKADGSRQKRNDSFQQHSKYFFQDGNVTFLVDGLLYCVHLYFFCRDSAYFSTRFDQLGVRDPKASSIIVSIGDVECKDFEAFLSVLYPQDFEEHAMSYEEWRSVLHLSVHWGFSSIRKLALRSINPPTPYERLLLARTYAVANWIVPALTELCERPAPLSLDEARGMIMEDVVIVATVREGIRSKAIRSGVSPTEISHHVEAARAGRPVPAAGYEFVSEVAPVSPTSEIIEPLTSPPVNGTWGFGGGIKLASRTEGVTFLEEASGNRAGGRSQKR